MLHDPPHDISLSGSFIVGAHEVGALSTVVLDIWSTKVHRQLVSQSRDRKCYIWSIYFLVAIKMALRANLDTASGCRTKITVDGAALLRL